MSIPERIGLIAGRGKMPELVCAGARAAGVKHIAVVAMHDETDPSIEKYADHVDWIYVGQIRKAAKALRKQGVSEAIMAGQVKPSRLFKGIRPDWEAVKILWKLRERNADTIFGAICAAFEKFGINFIDSTLFLGDYLVKEGVMTKCKPNRQQQLDIDYGVKVAKEISRLDIGQTVVVKKGTVLAVEGFEGTDKAIKRGGALGHGGACVVKVAKPKHDMRFDVPCIGMRTVESMVEGKIKTLAVHAGKVILIERDETLKAMDRAGICLVGIKCEW
ncbi:MAG: LpxI family protein [Lentisphaeria bacterium]